MKEAKLVSWALSVLELLVTGTWLEVYEKAKVPKVGIVTPPHPQKRVLKDAADDHGFFAPMFTRHLLVIVYTHHVGRDPGVPTAPYDVIQATDVMLE